MSITPPGSELDEPAVDERLVAPQTRYQIEDGRVVYVPPADEPHGSSHANLAGLALAHRAEGYAVAVDMLTRTSRINDVAPDVSIYPSARDSRTGGRQLEELAFQIARSESLGHAGTLAARLVSRGVRRIFAIDVERERALEWSDAIAAWSILDLTSQIEDKALAVPIPVAALLDAARADTAIARALRSKRHPEFLAEREEGREEGRARGLAEAILAVLASRGLAPSSDQRTLILGERDLARIDRWLASAASCTDIAALLAMPWSADSD